MEETVTRKHQQYRTIRASLIAAALAGGLASITVAQDASPQSQQRTFASPEEGVAALVDALRRDDTSALEAVLGPGSDDVISSGDRVADDNAREAFLRDYDAKNTLVPVNETTRTLEVGPSDWPLPIPIVRRDATWSFDLDAGRDELLSRRIGRNEANAIRAALAYVDAQRDYASEDHDGDGILEYAQLFGSTSGLRNGLYWPAQPGEPQSPLGPFFADAQSEGYFQSWADKGKESDRPPEPYFGYRFLILTAQGPSARGGAYDYIVDGNMIGGFALIAYPVEYGDSGVMTFIVNHDGVVYQRDLGPDTADIAPTASEFEPDSMWQRVPLPVGVASTP
jgi:hypothetical protein